MKAAEALQPFGRECGREVLGHQEIAASALKEIPEGLTVEFQLTLVRRLPGQHADDAPALRAGHRRAHFEIELAELGVMDAFIQFIQDKEAHAG